MPAAASRSIREVFREKWGRWEALEGASELVHGSCRPYGHRSASAGHTLIGTVVPFCKNGFTMVTSNRVVRGRHAAAAWRELDYWHWLWRQRTPGAAKLAIVGVMLAAILVGGHFVADGLTAAKRTAARLSDPRDDREQTGHRP